MESLACVITLCSGADTEAENRAADTALLLAIKNGDQNLVNVILESYCNVMHTNKQGKPVHNFSI